MAAAAAASHTMSMSNQPQQPQTMLTMSDGKIRYAQESLEELVREIALAQGATSAEAVAKVPGFVLITTPQGQDQLLNAAHIVVVENAPSPGRSVQPQRLTWGG